MKNKYILALIPTLMLGMGGASAADTNNATLNVTAEIGAGICSITVAPLMIPLGDIDPSLLAKLDKQLVNNTKEEITIKPECTILGAAAKTPNVTVDGTPLAASGAPAKLFRETASKSVGFGVGIASIATTGATPVWADLKGKGDKVAIQPGATKYFSVAVGCGALSDCSVNTLQAGDLSANVTFTFAYE